MKFAETNEGLDCFHVGGSRPGFDSFEFGGVHFDRSQGDQESEIFDLLGIEGTFREF